LDAVNIGDGMKFGDKDIGVKILEIITSGLYDGNPNCLREYVQNSIDAHAKNIKIYYENGENDLIVKDDGDGMDRDDLKFALGIGKSKKPESDVGWRGIGIWSGSSNCSRIVIITKKKNNGKIRVEIDNEIIRKGIRDERPLLQVLTDATSEIEEESLGKDESLEDTHFTIVRLESILPHQKWIFDNDKDIKDYLQKTVLLQFNEKEFTFSKEINDWLEKNGITSPSVHIEFKRDELFRPPFKSNIFFNKVIFKEFKTKEKLIAVGWFLTSNKNKVLLKPNKGIFFKMKGFTLGDENLVKNQHTGTYNPWQYGEIHIVSKEIRENAARNNFKYNTSLVETLLKQVGEFVRLLQLQNQYQSDRIVSKRIEKARKLMEKSDFSGAEGELIRAKSSLDRKRSFPKDTSLKEMQVIIDAQTLVDKKDMPKLKKEIIQAKSSLSTGKEDLDVLIKSLPPDLRKHVKTMGGAKVNPESNITDLIKEKLNTKAGLHENEIRELTKNVYGWRDVTGDIPLLVIEQGNDQKTKNRNYRFGVLIYAIHDLFVNLYKHQRGKDSFKWFDNLSEDEKRRVLIEMLTTIKWVCRLIDNSDKYKP
jgi:hypothetical protein